MGTKDEVAAGIETVACMLADLKSSLLSVSRSEVEEMVEAGLPLARLLVSGTLASALRLQHAVKLRHRSTVVIEDLDATSTGSSCLQSSDSSCSISVCPKRRYLRQPLWPWLRQVAWPWLRELTTRPSGPARRRPLLALAVVA